MRDFINAILAFIGSTSLTDGEFASMDLTGQIAQVYTAALYIQIANVLLSRESVSTVTDRLVFFFKAKGVDIAAVSTAKSNIYIGDVL